MAHTNHSTYIVASIGTRGEDFTVTKFEDGEPTPYDTYKIHVSGSIGSNGSCFCDCLGFRRQTYNKWKHKHIAVVLDFVKRGSPVGAMYEIHGAGQNYEIHFKGVQPT